MTLRLDCRLSFGKDRKGKILIIELLGNANIVQGPVDGEQNKDVIEFMRHRIPLYVKTIDVRQ